MGDDALLVAHEGRPAADQDEGRLAVLAEVTGEPPPERDEGVLGDAVGRGEQPLLAARRDHLRREDPLGDEERAAAEVDRARADATVLRDLVDGDVAASGGAEPAQSLEGVLLVPRGRVVPVDEAGVGADGDSGERGVVAVLVEVVEPKDGEPQSLGEAGLPGPAGSGQDDHLGSTHLGSHSFRRSATEVKVGD